MVEHDLTRGGRVSYHMTSPAGEPDLSMPTTTATVTFEALEAGGTRMAIRSSWASLEAMEKLLAMGMDIGMSMALGQTGAILAEAA